jgi:hypothetical protein
MSEGAGTRTLALVVCCLSARHHRIYIKTLSIVWRLAGQCNWRMLLWRIGLRSTVQRGEGHHDRGKKGAFAPPFPPNRTGGSPASGSPVDGLPLCGV